MEMGSSSSSIERNGLVEYKPGNGDDGWYLVSITLRDGKLVIHYVRSPGKPDEVLDLADLKCLEDDLYSKFRYPSIPLNDKYCGHLLPKQPLLVAYPSLPYREDSTLYFDACFEKVFPVKHKNSHLGEKCMCIFRITWLSGPNVGQQNHVNCASIYLPEFGNIEKHFILKEATKFFEDHLVRSGKRLRTIPAEDMNGLIVLKNVISEH